MRLTEEKTTLDKPTFYLDKYSEDFFPLEVLNVKWDSNKAITLDKFFFPRVECSAKSLHYYRFPVWKSKTTEELANCLWYNVCSAALCSDSAHGLNNTVCCCSNRTAQCQKCRMLKYLIPTGGFHQTRTLALQFFDLQHEDHPQLKPGPVPLGHHLEGKLMRM
jgi:hypothetical protein